MKTTRMRVVFIEDEEGELVNVVVFGVVWNPTVIFVKELDNLFT